MADAGDTPNAKPHWLGHRDRLRQKLLSRGSEALDDYELLETLLFAFLPRRDVKPCLLYTSPSPRDQRGSRMPSSA